MLKTGNRSYMYYAKGTKTADYKKMAEHGYSCADFSGISDPTSIYYTMSDEDMKVALTAEKERAHTAGITFSQVHGTWPVDDTTAEKRAANLEAMKCCVRATAYLDCKYLVVHPLMPYSWQTEKDPDFAEQLNEEFFRELCAYAAEYDVCICIENMPTTLHRLAGIENLVKFVKRLDLPNFFICLDTGHCLIHGDDSGDMVRICGDLLKVLHVHDNNGSSDAHSMPYCNSINWTSFKKGLADIGFDGCLSIESGLNSHLPPELHEYMLKTTAMIAKELADI